MADSDAKSKMKNSKKTKKRKGTIREETERLPKVQRIEPVDKVEETKPRNYGRGNLEPSEFQSEHLEFDHPWKNLQLILGIQNEQLDAQRKVRLAFNFVQSRVEEGDGSDQDHETIKLPRLLYFLNDWIQSLLTSSDKKNWSDGKKHQLEGTESYVDFRCWEIFKFCLLESLKLHVSLNISRNLLQPVHFIAKSAMSLLEDPSIWSKEPFITDERYKLYDTALECVSLVFSSHGGISNQHLDSWLSTTCAVVELVQKMYDKNLDCRNMSDFALRFLCLMLQPFSKFLRAHPAKKSGFHDFLDMLLEPLLHLLGELHLRVSGSNPIWTRKSLKVVEEVLSHGLFHPVHIDGFLSLHASEKYADACNDRSQDSKAVIKIKSYHRHFFDVLHKIISRKNAMAMGSIGFLFHFFVDPARKFKGSSALNERTKTVKKTGAIRLLEEGETHSSSNMCAETRKSLFNFFVQMMEPLLLEINAYLQAKTDGRLLLSNLHVILKSISNLLSNFRQENIYVRTEDVSGGACLNFFREVYNVLISCSTHLLSMLNYDRSNKMELEIFTLSANEILVAMGYLLEIEYEVIGENLMKLWLIMFSYLAINCTLMDVVDQSSLFSSITGLGCQIIYLYSQLRQVKNAILAFCKAIRLITSHDENAEECFSCSLATLSNEVYSESVERLLSSQKFIHAIHKAIKSIPEGQVSGCIRQLTDDISESLRWIKDCSPLINGDKFYKQSVICTTQVFDVRLELLGRVLSRLYALVLDSVTVTEGNNNLIGIAIKEVVALLRPCLSTLVGQQPAVSMFLSSVLGKTVNDWIAGKEVLKKFGPSSQWVLVFFFNLFVSCRSLLRQAISLMPPGLSKKMCAEVGDLTAYSACELMLRLDSIDMSYFSWIVQPAASLLVVMQIISDIFFQDGSADCICLIYIFHCMALQRLVDLNRLITLFNYFPNTNSSKIKALKDEAAGLTNLMMQNLSRIYQSKVFISDDVTEEDISSQALHQNYGWDLGVYVACEKSLPTAIWSNLCKNIDVWGNYAAKKQLKKFISHLLHTSIHCVTSNYQELGFCKVDEDKLIKRVTLPQISSELLCNSILYEQRFVCRILASRFCWVLEKSVQQLFSKITCIDVNLRASPKWPEFLNVLGNSTMVVCGIKDVPPDGFAVGKSIDHSCDKLPEEISPKKAGFCFTTKSFAVCHHLLNLLCWMPDRNSKSISRCVTCILNLERLVVSALLNCQGRKYQDYYYEFLRLFVSCRKTLRYTMMGLFEKAEAGQTLPDLIISGGSFLVLWLFKSVSAITGLEVLSSERHVTSIQSIVFSLIDHTSYVLSRMGKYQLIHALYLEKEAEKPSDDMSNSGIGHEDNSLQSAQQVDSPQFEILKSLTYMADDLNEQTKSLLVSLGDASCYDHDGEFQIPYENMNRLSSIVSCFSGFFQGLASVLDLTDVKGSDHKEKMLMWKLDHASDLNIRIYALVEFIHSFVHKLFIEINHPSKSLCDFSALQKVMEPENENSIASVLMRVDSFEPQHLNKPLLQSLLKGNHPEASFLLRQLLIAFSALLRLNTQRGSSSLLSSLIPTFVEISQVLLLEFTKMVEVPQQSSFLLLDGVLTYLRELAYYFPLTDPTTSRKVYERLIELYLRAIGKAISLQGKRATLAFHERQSSTKTLNRGSLNVYSSSGLYCICLDEFKVRLRISFKAYIEKQSELHLLSTIQAIERALVGVQERCTMIYDIKTSLDGGSVSSLVAAGIDCFDMVLEFVSGRKGLKLVKRHIQGLVAAVFNIILHLQGPHIFHGDLTCGAIITGPDPGSVILMCVEVLVTISRKHALFLMDVWHVGFLLRIPAALFLNFHQLRISEASVSSESLMSSRDKISYPVATINNSHVDLQFSINLFSACCQLLCTIIKHRQSECKLCIAHLEASVAVLLNCLETVDNKSILSWKVEEGIKCACFLRRVYEEIKQQKDILSQQCSLFLSNYIWVYSGYGPKRSGIRREIDEALRPGVYALIDACSVDDLQYLHTVLGEGPCRNTLASLQHDYKLNFKYEGKV